MVPSLTIVGTDVKTPYTRSGTRRRVQAGHTDARSVRKTLDPGSRKGRRVVRCRGRLDEDPAGDRGRGLGVGDW